MSCPKCNSDDWKLASFVYKSGAIDVKDKDSGTNTSLQHQTKLSEMAAPPIKPKGGGFSAYWWTIIIVIVVIGGKIEWLGWLFFIGSILYWPKVKAYIEESNNEEFSKYEANLENWNKTQICQRCGHFYIP